MNKETANKRLTRRPGVRVAAFLVRDGRVLLVQQQKEEKRYWLLPGGAVEQGETLVAAVVRELQEEVGLDVTVLEPPLALVEAISPDGGRTKHIIQVIFAVHAETAAIPMRRDPTVEHLSWAAVEELEDLVLHPPIHDLVACWLEAFRDGEPQPERWPEFEFTGPRWSA